METDCQVVWRRLAWRVSAWLECAGGSLAAPRCRVSCVYGVSRASSLWTKTELSLHVVTSECVRVYTSVLKPSPANCTDCTIIAPLWDGARESSRLCEFMLHQREYGAIATAPHSSLRRRTVRLTMRTSRFRIGKRRDSQPQFRRCLGAVKSRRKFSTLSGHAHMKWQAKPRTTCIEWSA